MRRHPAPVRLSWRWLVDSPLVVAAWIAVLLGAWSLQRVGGALEDASALKTEADGELARLAAEAAVMQLPLDDDTQSWEREVGPVAVAVQRRGDRLWIASQLPGLGEFGYVARLLPGRAPAAFGVPRSRVVPDLDDAMMRSAVLADDAATLRRDSGVALLYYESGTDLDDFVLLHGRVDRQGEALIEVPGHLWIEPGSTPLVLHCASDVTIVVRGNFYVGRSVRIVGPGRLLIAVVGSEAARPFADRDGNGRRSPNEGGGGAAVAGAPIEGGGNVYFGLRDASTALELAVGVLAVGHLHLRCDTALQGPLVCAADPVELAPDVRLESTGQRLFQPARELVPGYLAGGEPRPGLLAPADHVRARFPDQEPLYLGTSAR